MSDSKKASQNFIKLHARNRVQGAIYIAWLSIGIAHKLKIRRLKIISELTGGWFSGGGCKIVENSRNRFWVRPGCYEFIGGVTP